MADTIYDNIDSLKARRKNLRGDRVDMAFLQRCQTLYENGHAMREAREKTDRFVYGDQWGELITVNGKTMTEKQYLSSVGNFALQTNQIKKVVDGISGIYTKQHNEPAVLSRDAERRNEGDLMSLVLQTNWENNQMQTIEGDALKDLIIGGFIVEKEEFRRNFFKGGKLDVWSRFVNPNYIFWDSPMLDSRFWDVSLIGEIHDLTKNELYEGFARKPEDFEWLKELYSDSTYSDDYMEDYPTENRNEASAMTFFTPRDRTRCRVFEVWTLERRPRYHVHDTDKGTMWDINTDDKEMIRQIEETNANRKRIAKENNVPAENVHLIEYKNHWFVDVFWYYRFLTPEGIVLREGESDLPDRSNPYTLLAIPFVNGRICGHISDAVEQNRAMNRMLTLDDWVTRQGAKGVTFIPENYVPKGMSYEKFAEQWTSISGVIFYTPKPGLPDPKVFYGNTAQLETTAKVKMMNDLLNGTTAFEGAIMGQTPHAGTSAALYQQQTENSSTPTATLLKKFGNFMEQIATKKLMLICQNYTIDDYMRIAGENDAIACADIDYSDLGDIPYKCAIKQSSEYPTYRWAKEDLLLRFINSGQMQMDDYLAQSQMPWATEMRQYLQMKNQAIQQNMPTQAAAPVQ